MARRAIACGSSSRAISHGRHGALYRLFNDTSCTAARRLPQTDQQAHQEYFEALKRGIDLGDVIAVVAGHHSDFGLIRRDEGRADHCRDGPRHGAHRKPPRARHCDRPTPAGGSEAAQVKVIWLDVRITNVPAIELFRSSVSGLGAFPRPHRAGRDYLDVLYTCDLRQSSTRCATCRSLRRRAANILAS
jgi:hypothetical protein